MEEKKQPKNILRSDQRFSRYYELSGRILISILGQTAFLYLLRYIKLRYIDQGNDSTFYLLFLLSGLGFNFWVIRFAYKNFGAIYRYFAFHSAKFNKTILWFVINPLAVAVVFVSFKLFIFDNPHIISKFFTSGNGREVMVTFSTISMIFMILFSFYCYWILSWRRMTFSNRTTRRTNRSQH